MDENIEYIEKEYKKVENQNIVVLSFLTPSLKRINYLTEMIEKEKTLKKKIALYEELVKEKFSTRAVKILGVFENQEHARKYVTENLSEYKDFHIFVGEVHKWLAFNEDFCDSKEYLDEQLSNLLKEHKENKLEQEKLLKQRIQKTKDENVLV
jgi:hypothetical protein